MMQIKTDKLNLFVLISVVFLISAAIVSYLFFDTYVSKNIFDAHREIDEFPGSFLIKSLGKTYIPLWFLFLYGLLKKRIEIILTGVVALLLVLVFISPSKVAFSRQRPNLYFANQAKLQLGQTEEKAKSYFFGLHKPLNQSFPSGDTASIFALVTAVVPFISGSSFLLLLAIASAVGFLRVIGLAHYPSDVLIGAALGIICGRIAVLICEKLFKENSSPFGEKWRNIAAVGIFLIPSLVLFKGLHALYIFLISSFFWAGCMYLAIAIRQMLNRAKPENENL